MQNVMEILLDMRIPNEGVHRVMGPSGSIAVNRQHPDAVGRQPINDGNAEVTIPPIGSLLREPSNSIHVDIKVCLDDNSNNINNGNYNL